MKKTYTITNKIIFLSTILLFTSVALSEPEWITFPGGSGMPGEKPIITVESNTTDATVYTVQIPGMWREQVEASNNIIFDRIEIPEYGFTLDDGRPMIPVIRELFAVPYDSTVDISISDVQQVTLDDYYVYPAQPPYTPSQPTPPFEYDEDFYNSNVWYPLEGIATDDLPGVLREYEVRDMNMRAMKFNPYQEELNVKYFFRVTMTYTSPGGWVEEPNPSGDFYQMYPYLIRNLEGIYGKGEFGKEGNPPKYPRYLIIYDRQFENNIIFQQYMNMLKTYLEERFSFVDVLSTSQTGNDALSIWYLLQSWWFLHSLEYVLLVGDIPRLEPQYGIEMPTWTLTVNKQSYVPSDIGYARVSPWGTNDPLEADIYPDIFVGRMPIKNVNEFVNIVRKTLDYYYGDLGNPDWEQRCIFASHKGEENYDYITPKDDIREYEHYTHAPPFDPNNEHRRDCYGDTKTNQDLIGYINTGYSVLNFLGHGQTEQWHQWDYLNDY
jgi:hypothetical protein